MTLKPFIDEIIADSAHDAELAAGIRWIRKRAIELGMDPYKLAEQIIIEHMASKRARQWIKERENV